MATGAHPYRQAFAQPIVEPYASARERLRVLRSAPRMEITLPSPTNVPPQAPPPSRTAETVGLLFLISLFAIPAVTMLVFAVAR